MFTHQLQPPLLFQSPKPDALCCVYAHRQVLQDIANASDEEEEAVPPANAAAAPAQALPPGPAALVPAPAGVPASRALPAAAGSAAGEGFAARKGSAATGADAAAQRATEEEEARRRQILSRLESFEEDTKLGRTVKVGSEGVCLIEFSSLSVMFALQASSEHMKSWRGSGTWMAVGRSMVVGVAQTGRG